jgi:hypothetical protein
LTGDTAGNLPGTGDGRAQVKQACTVLYGELPSLDVRPLQDALEAQVGRVNVEWAAPGSTNLPLTAGIVQFGPHRIAMLALNAPASEETLARTVAVSPMPEERRRELMNHKAVIRLLHIGEGGEALGQLTALYRVAGALLRQGGLGILNERAALAQPAELVETYLGLLGTETPPLSLWVGAISFSATEGAPGRFFMRTYGMEQFDLPELGMYYSDQSAADAIYHLLVNVGLYMVEGGPSLQIEPGQTAEFLKKSYLFTLPSESGPEFQAPNGLLLLVEV